MLRLNLQHQALSNLRFAYSPLLELSTSYRVLRGNWEEATYWRWLEEAKQATADVSYPYMDALISSGHLVKSAKKSVPKGYIPDFLTPTPTHPILDIESEFARMQALPADVIRDCIQLMISSIGESALLCDFLVYPHESMASLVLELRDYWHRTLAHHWNRMVAVLENDILYHSRVLTLNGIETLLPTLDDVIGYEAGTITVDHWRGGCFGERSRSSIAELECPPDKVFDVESDQFHLVPVIFAAHGFYYQVAAPWQPMILYTPRGAGLWNYETPEPLEALELIMGAGKSRILLALETPFSTGELAQKLSLTAGAVSQQLGKLHQAGLVESHRSGKHVFYRLSERGIQLLALFC